MKGTFLGNHRVARITRWTGYIVAAIIVVPVQSYLVFSLWGKGSFLSASGAKFAIGCVVVDFVVFVVATMHLDRFRISTVPIPHSMIGESLRGAPPPQPPKPYGDEKVSDASSAVEGMKRKPYE